jgi:hypothetical protein
MASSISCTLWYKLVYSVMHFKSLKLSNKLIWILCVLSIALGFLLYVFCRDENLFLFKWLKYFGVQYVIIKMRRSYLLTLPEWTYYSLPYGLWNFSLGSALIAIWSRKLTFMTKCFILSAVFVSGVLIELLQGLHIVRGTFDLVDLIVLIISLVFVILILNIKSNEKSI